MYIQITVLSITNPKLKLYSVHFLSFQFTPVQFVLLVVVKSISKCVVNEDHVDSVSVSGESGNQELAADSIHGFAVKAFGILPIQVLFMRFQVQLRF